MTIPTVVWIEIAIACGITIWQCHKGVSELVAQAIDELSLRLFVVGLLIVFVRAVAKALGT